MLVDLYQIWVISDLEPKKVTFTSAKIINIYLVCELGNWPVNLSNNLTITFFCLVLSNLQKNTALINFIYNFYGIGLMDQDHRVSIINLMPTIAINTF